MFKSGHASQRAAREIPEAVAPVTRERAGASQPYPGGLCIMFSCPILAWSKVILLSHVPSHFAQLVRSNSETIASKLRTSPGQKQA